MSSILSIIGTTLIGYTMLSMFQGFISQIFFFLGQVIGFLQIPFRFIDQNLFTVNASVSVIYSLVAFMFLRKLVRSVYVTK